jgi:para-nitrobenzyl esterase
VRKVTDFGAACTQPSPIGKSVYASKIGPTSEDCLFLNIWAPEDAKNAAVFVWIHGGSLTAGASNEAMYDGTKLAQEGIIVVSINYRLGVLGYLAHPELSAESPNQISGNYGLLDQIEALKWIQKNIGSFGGDAGNVTIAGESAGALSVMYLMASSQAHGLFHKAVAQSAYMVSTPVLREKKHGAIPAEDTGVWLAGEVGAETIGDMRAMDAQDITNSSSKVGYFPFGTIDGHILKRQLVEVFDRGEQAKVPILAGFNSGEIRSLRFLLPPKPKNMEEYEAAIRTGYGELADLFLRLYPSDNIGESMLAATRDAIYGWTAERLALKQSQQGLPAYFYLWDHGYPEASKWNLHAFHASEIPYIFGTAKRTPPLWPKVPKHTSEIKLAKAMLSYWASFARTGTPSAEGSSPWPRYAEGRAYMYIADKPYAAHNLLPGMYELHETVVCRRRAVGTVAWNWNVGVIAPPLPETKIDCL